MSSVRLFVRYWLAFTLVIVGYALADRQLNPSLEAETSFSMKPDLRRLPDLLHWGGRLIHHDAWMLLVSNAVVLGGAFSLGLSAWTARRRLKAFRSEPQASDLQLSASEERGEVEDRISIVAVATPSNPPPA